MDKPVKEVKSKGEIRKFFNTKVVKSEKVVIGGKTMYMTIDKIDDSGKEVKRKKNTNSKIREKHMELNFPQIDYKRGFNKLVDNLIDQSIITNAKKAGYLYKGPKFLHELEEEIEGAVKNLPKEPDDDEIVKIFHNIQIWGGITGRQVYVRNNKKFPDDYKKRFEFNFSIKIYKKLVFRCLNFDLENDWVNEVSDWTIDLNKKIHGINTSFSTKHIRFWLHKKLKDNAPPIFDEVILGKKDEYKKRWISGLNKYQKYHPLNNNTSQENLIRYWKQMIKKSKKEKISLKQLERILFNCFTIRSINHNTTTKVLKEVISGSSKSEIKKFPRGKNHEKATKLEKEQYKHFNYLVDEIALYINKYLVKEKYFKRVYKKEYELLKDDFEKLIEFAFQGRNEPKDYGSMEELFKGFKG